MFLQIFKNTKWAKVDGTLWLYTKHFKRRSWKFLRTSEMVESSSAHTIPQAVENRSPEFLGTQFEEILNFFLSQDKVL